MAESKARQKEREEIEKKLKKIEYNLGREEVEGALRIKLLNIYRYELSKKEQLDKVEKVVYNEKLDKLEYSKSVEVGIGIASVINDMIREAEGIELKQELFQVMKEVYYYLARHLFEYYLPALEFGIEPAKQFIAPRTCVLNGIARELSKFYYRKDRPIMTISMPQRNWKDRVRKKIYKLGVGKRSRLT